MLDENAAPSWTYFNIGQTEINAFLRNLSHERKLLRHQKIDDTSCNESHEDNNNCKCMYMYFIFFSSQKGYSWNLLVFLYSFSWHVTFSLYWIRLIIWGRSCFSSFNFLLSFRSLLLSCTENMLLLLLLLLRLLLVLVILLHPQRKRRKLAELLFHNALSF